jgi:two-component system cell cycle response regulator
MKILIAEDEAVTRERLVRTLAPAGYDLTVVTNGRQALEHLCRPDAPRLALLDWLMPEMDGRDVCLEVRRRLDLSYVYLVLLTVKESKQDVVAGLEAGADDYLIKPFDPEELKARLRAGRRILDLEDRLVKAREAMRFKATYDPLTSLFNRGAMMDFLARELARSRRERVCTTLLLGDLDRFKNVNDTYGHVVGDEVLREVARRLVKSVRSYDFAGRYGGEEFLVILNNCETAHALGRAEAIRHAIAHPPIETTSGPIPVTMSLGVLSSRDWGPQTVEEILRAVDAALYEAKAAGRDCARLAKPEASSTPSRQQPADPSIPERPLTAR